MVDFFGTTGNDILTGTSDDDNIYANGGTDTINAGDGNDLVLLLTQTAGYGTTNGGNGIDTLRVDRGVFAPNGYVGPYGYQSMYAALLNNITSFERLQFNSLAGDRMQAQIFFGGTSGASINSIGSGLSATAELIGGAGQDSLLLSYNNAVSGGTVTAPSFTYTNWTTPTRAYGLGDRVSVIASGVGSVTIHGSAHLGVQALIGGSGSDIIYGSNDMDLIDGGAGGSDQLYGGGGDDGLVLVNTYLINNFTSGAESTRTGAGTLFDGGAGTDFLVLGGNVNFAGTIQNIEGLYLTPGYGNSNDNLYVMNAFQLLLESQNYTTVRFSGATFAALPSNLILDGQGTIIVDLANGGSVFSGSAFSFDPGSYIELFVYGGTGSDAITGTVNSDYIIGGAGSDMINGGNGDDFLHTATLLNLEEISFLEYPYDTPLLDLGSEVDTVNAGAGDDIILAGYGDNVDGGTNGATGDTLFISFLIAPGSLNLDLSLSSLTVGGGTISGIEHIAWFQSGNFDDIITVGGNGVVHHAETFIFGEGGNDALTGGGGVDILSGGIGADTVTGLDGDDVLFSNQYGILGSEFDFEDPAGITSGDNGTEVDTLSGGAGDDWIFAGFGDQIDGGTNGTWGDRLSLSLLGATAGLTLDFSTMPAAIGGGTITGVEHLEWLDGSNFADNITLGSSTASTTLFGHGGNDVLTGNGSNNVIAGGAGADTLNGVGGGDILCSADFPEEFFSAPNQMARGAYLFGVDGVYDYSATTPALDTGTEADTLIGSGNTTFSAGFGDTVNGGVNTPGNVLHISFLGAANGITVDFQLASQTIGGGTISGIEYVGWVQGSDHADTITVGPANSQFGFDGAAILGMAGDDNILALTATFIDGGEGNDTIEGGGGNLGWVLGGNGNDIIRGVANASTTLEGGAGNDTIYAGLGAIYGGSGNDIIYGSTAGSALLIAGEDGDDQIIVYDGPNTGNNRISGGNGADTITGSNRAEVIVAADFIPNTLTGTIDNGVEIDTIVASGGDDEVWIGYGDNADGGAGSDLLYLSLFGATSGVTLNTAAALSATPLVLGGGTIVNFERMTRLRGSEFADTITVSGLTTTLILDGGGGDDQVTATNSGVQFNGGEGADRFVAGSATDTFQGQNGDDWFVGGTSNDSDIFVGGAGNDTADYSAFATGITIDLGGPLLGGFLTGPGNDRLNSVENLIGGSGNDALTGSAVANVLDGGDGNDLLDGGAGSNTLIGGNGTDTLRVSATGSVASISGFEALDFVGGANLTLTGTQFRNGLATNSALSGTGTLTVNMDAGINFLASGMSFTPTVATVVNGTSGIDIIKLGLGASTGNIVNSGDGVDQIRGSNGVDTINGGIGNDKIMALGGADVLTGGAGNDQFRYFQQSDSGLGAAADRVTDFTIGGDRLNFLLIDADAVTAGDQAFNFVGTAAFANTGIGQIRYQDSGADLLVQADVNGDGVADMEIILQGNAGGTLTAGDFIL